MTTHIKPEPKDDEECITGGHADELDAVLSFLSGTLAPEEDPLNFSQNDIGFDRPRSPQWISGDDMLEDQSDCSTAGSSPPHSPPQDDCPSSPDSEDNNEIKQEYNFDDSSTHQNFFDDEEIPNLFNLGSSVERTKNDTELATTATQRRQQRAAKLKEARKRATARTAIGRANRVAVKTEKICSSSSPSISPAAGVVVNAEAPALSKKEKRRLDNRRSAELSRKRKRDRLDLLERQVKFLKAQSASLSSRLAKYEHVEPMPQFEDQQTQPVYRGLSLSNKYIQKRNQQHLEKQKQKQEQKQTNDSKSQLTLLEQYSAQLSVWPILQILIVIAAVTVGLQSNILAAVVYSVIAHWCSTTDMLPAQTKTAVAIASISVVAVAWLQPDMLAPQLKSYCISPNLA